MTRYPGYDAKFLSWYTRFPYTHTSIGFEDDMDTFYTFVSKGFFIESIRKYEKTGRESFPCALYEITVPEKTYYNVKKLVLSYKARKEKLKYSTLGLVCCFFKIPLRRKNKYFCSHFVAEVLQQSKILRLKKKSTLYFPKDISRHKELKLIYVGNHLSFVENFVNKK
jgi:hypothetical protein